MIHTSDPNLENTFILNVMYSTYIKQTIQQVLSLFYLFNSQQLCKGKIAAKFTEGIRKEKGLKFTKKGNQNTSVKILIDSRLEIRISDKVNQAASVTMINILKGTVFRC